MLQHNDTEQTLVDMADKLLNTRLTDEVATFLAMTKGCALAKTDTDCRPLGMGSKLQVITTLQSNTLHTTKF
jgi:hypothetical protein